jgi:hypothetical protein
LPRVPTTAARRGLDLADIANASDASARPDLFDLALASKRL